MGKFVDLAIRMETRLGSKCVDDLWVPTRTSNCVQDIPQRIGPASIRLRKQCIPDKIAAEVEAIDQLTVLQVGTLNKPVRPDQGYGPVETVICNVDKGLVSAGHRSIVACSADSQTVGERHVTVRQGFGGYCQEESQESEELLQRHLTHALKRVMRGDIDVVHMHEWVRHLYNGVFNPPLPIVVTLHVPATQSGLDEVSENWNGNEPQPSVYFIAISEHQKREYSALVNIYRVIHHGVDVETFPVPTTAIGNGYLFTIGRITPDKGQDKAIALARKSGFKLFLAGSVQNKVEDNDFFESLRGSIDLIVDVSKFDVGKNYYSSVIKPLVDCDQQVIFIGELNTSAKKHWYQHAIATLFPIQWEEPFGLVPIESMACGTPVLAMKRGALPEIVVDGETGFLVDSLDGMVASLQQLDTIDRSACRRHIQQNFSLTRMAQDYIDVYRQVVEEHPCKHHPLEPQSIPVPVM
ncbi:MAG: glycosyltransferase family 4 protein [Acidobacteria bacterium]|nr:glycosyltransferase family 4 protein [Acidobacteriota bacterium]